MPRTAAIIDTAQHRAAEHGCQEQKMTNETFILNTHTS